MAEVAKLRVLSDIIIVKFADMPVKLVELLRSRNFNTIEIDKLEKLEDALKQSAKPILLAFSAASIETTNRGANKLASSSGLSNLPVVFVGKEIQKHERMLSQAFEVVATLEYPCDFSEVYDLIVSVSDYAEKLKKDNSSKERSANQDSVVVAPEDKQIKTVISDPKQTIVALSANKVAETVLSSIAELNLRGKDLGAGVLVQLLGSSYFSDRELLPQNQLVREKTQEILARTDRWGTAHLFKVADVSSKIIDVLSIPSNLKESARSAAFLFSSEFAHHSYLMTKDYTMSDCQELREQLAQHISKSAQIVLKQSGLKQISALISVVAEIVAGKGCSDNDDGLIASSIVAADAVDRVCWGNNGRWSSSNIYSFMQRLRKSQIIQIHPKVLSCIVVTLTEAVNTKTSSLLLPKLTVDQRQELEKRRTDYTQQQQAENETRLCIHEVLPGMVLSRPIEAYDGSVILESGVELDHDLIMRLWQLTMLKPLLLPVVSLKKPAPLVTKQTAEYSKNPSKIRPNSLTGVVAKDLLQASSAS